MNAERYTFDTNVLFYALDPDSGDKHHLASGLVGQADYNRAILTLQALGELCNAITKKRPVLRDRAVRAVQRHTVMFDLIHAFPTDLTEAMQACQEHGIPFWDAMLWATARRAGCTLLLTEDLQDGRVLGGVTFRNPFLMTETELDSLRQREQ